MSLNSQPQLYTHPKFLTLVPREREVLKELAQGNSNNSIARTLSISTYAVDGYVQEIYRKLGVRNRAMAAIVAFRYGVVGVPSPAPVSASSQQALSIPMTGLI